MIKNCTADLDGKILIILCDKLKDQTKDQVYIKRQLAELENKIEKLEIRYIEENFEKSLFENSY